MYKRQIQRRRITDSRTRHSLSADCTTGYTSRLNLVTAAGGQSQQVPYIDPTVAVIMALFLIKEPVKVIFRSIRNLVLFAPEKEVFDQIYAIVNKHMQEYPYEVTFLDVIQTGRKLWVEVYIGNQTDVIHISILHRVRDEIKQELRHKYDQVYIEIIPD